MKIEGIILLCALFKLANSLPNARRSSKDCFNVEISKHNYQAYITHDKKTCAGAIVSTSYVLTVAHCMKGATLSKIKIRVGTSKYNTEGVVVQAGSVIFHPKFVPNKNNYDAALIKLSQQLKTSKSIAPIALATVAPPQQTNVVVSGWSTADFSGPDLNLKIAYGYTQPNHKCNYVASSLCANTSTCICESGSPLTIVGQNQLLGLFGYHLMPFCLLDLNLTYLSIPFIADWIKSVINSEN